MPSVSEAQHKAMEAAAHGNSTLGIPESVGKEFVAADAEKEKWITINGRHVQIDGDGNIIKGGAGMGIENVSSGKHKNIDAGELYSILSKEEDKSGATGVKILAIEIFNEKPELREKIIGELNNLGISIPDDFKKNEPHNGHEKINKEDHEDHEEYKDPKKIDTKGFSYSKLENPDKIIPVNGIEDKSKYDKLVEDFKKNGWIGRPILTMDVGNGLEALTGSHRILAAREAGINIPIYDIQGAGDMTDKEGNTINNFSLRQGDMEYLVKFLLKNGDKEAAKLIKKEEFHNNKNDSSETNSIFVITELDIAKAISIGELDSPQFFENVHLFDIRITGTGAAFRPTLNEYVYRDPDNYLNDEFLQRCNGLPVIWIHPPQVLNSVEFAKRIIGTIFLPYIKDNEVWGIAKIYDDEAIKIMLQSQMSTSPGVKFSESSGNEKIKIDGEDHHLLIEGKPILVDHLAICEQGVWDKMSEPTGVRIDSITSGGVKMDEKEEVKKDADPMDLNKTILDALGKLGERLDGMDKRFDAMEENKPEVKADSEDEDKEKKAEKERMDADHVETKRRLDAMEDALKSDCDETNSAAMNDAQYKMDAVLQLHSKRAPKPMTGERVDAYRVRVLKQLQEFSPSLKTVDLGKVCNDSAAFAYMESQIINDATAAANDPSKIAQTLPRGQLREVKKQYGRVEATEFLGDIDGFIGAFKQPVGVGNFVKPSKN